MKQRVLTAIGLIPLVLGALFFSSPWPIGILAAAIVFLAASEIKKMLGGAPTIPLLHSIIVLIGIPFVVGDPTAQRMWLWLGLAAWALGLLFTYAVVKSGERLVMGGVGAALWVTGGLISLLVMHQMRQTGSLWFFKNLALLSLVPLWVGDSAGYFIGRWIGKHPLAPTISPKKTIEGGVANLIGCTLAGLVLGKVLQVGIPLGLICGLTAGVLGQFGDLFESWVKRQADLKDSGSLLPGHGGVMDRIDSILFTAPVVACLLVALAH